MRSIFFAILFTFQSFAFAATPEDVIQEYFQKVKTDGFASVADLIHPAELKKMQEMMLPVIIDGLESDQAAAFKSFADPKDPKKVAKFTDLEFMKKVLSWISGLQPMLSEIMKTAKVETLGHVVEGDLQHVVVRTKMKANGVEMEELSVMTIKDFEGKPMMTLSGEMKGMAEALKNRPSSKK